MSSPEPDDDSKPGGVPAGEFPDGDQLDSTTIEDPDAPDDAL